MNATFNGERDQLNFAQTVRDRFAFLSDLGFNEIEASPTLVRFRKGEIEVDVYHGRQSYEIGLGLTRQEVRYSLADIIELADPHTAKGYSTPTAVTQKGVVDSLTQIADLTKRYGEQALQDDSAYFSMLENKRKLWMERYWLERLASELRPQASEAFRQGKYQLAAEIYKRIRPLLSRAERKKLSIAEERNSESAKPPVSPISRPKSRG